jgi:hypothetical protein
MFSDLLNHKTTRSCWCQPANDVWNTDPVWFRVTGCPALYSHQCISVCKVHSFRFRVHIDLGMKLFSPEVPPKSWKSIVDLESDGDHQAHQPSTMLDSIPGKISVQGVMKNTKIRWFLSALTIMFHSCLSMENKFMLAFPAVQSVHDQWKVSDFIRINPTQQSRKSSLSYKTDWV